MGTIRLELKRAATGISSKFINLSCKIGKNIVTELSHYCAQFPIHNHIVYVKAQVGSINTRWYNS